MTVPTGHRPPARHAYLVERFNALSAERQAEARRAADELRDTHTLYAAWNVAITKAERPDRRGDKLSLGSEHDATGPSIDVDPLRCTEHGRTVEWTGSRTATGSEMARCTVCGTRALLGI